jgi:hypothetical protein
MADAAAVVLIVVVAQLYPRSSDENGGVSHASETRVN